MAGRSEAKLQKVLVAAGKAVNQDLAKTPVIIADTADQVRIKSI